MRSRTVFSSRWSKVKQATEVPDWQITAEEQTNCGQQTSATAYSYNKFSDLLVNNETFCRSYIRYCYVIVEQKETTSN